MYNIVVVTEDFQPTSFQKYLLETPVSLYLPDLLEVWNAFDINIKLNALQKIQQHSVNYIQLFSKECILAYSTAFFLNKEILFQLLIPHYQQMDLFWPLKAMQILQLAQIIYHGCVIILIITLVHQSNVATLCQKFSLVQMTGNLSTQLLLTIWVFEFSFVSLKLFQKLAYCNSTLLLY